MRAQNATQRLELLRQAGALMAGGQSAAEAARAVGLSPATLSRWQADYRAGGLEALAPGKSTGRRPLAELLSAGAVQRLRQNYLKTKSVRLCFDVFAADPECPAELREQLLAKRDLPPSLMRLVKVNPQVRAVHQGDRPTKGTRIDGDNVCPCPAASATRTKPGSQSPITASTVWRRPSCATLPKSTTGYQVPPAL
jgi:transposase-like protein